MRDSESSPIQPNDIRMTRPSGNNVVYVPPPVSLPTNASFSQDGELTIARMVDKSIALVLDDDDDLTMRRAFYYMADKDHSVNQSLTNIQTDPLVFDIELKKALSDRDPEVQLAIWKAAYYSKLLNHGWDTSLPMPGLVVNGSNWEYYIGYVQDETLVSRHQTRYS